MKSALIIFALFAGSMVGPASAISNAELSLGGVALGDSETRVSAVLGKAPRQTDTGEGIAHQYAGLTVLIGWVEHRALGKQRRVVQLTATGSNICTPSGICPGSLASKAIANYGKPFRAKRESGSVLEYYSGQSSCWLQLVTSGNTIHTISAVCQP